MNAWLIEYVGAVPGPVYVPENYALTHGHYTMDPWEAKRFETKEQAEAWDFRHDYNAPWEVIGHSFDVRCCVCGESTPQFLDTGDVGLCDACIPF